MSGKPKVYQGVRVKITVKELLQQRRARQAATGSAVSWGRSSSSSSSLQLAESVSPPHPGVAVPGLEMRQRHICQAGKHKSLPGTFCKQSTEEPFEAEPIPAVPSYCPSWQFSSCLSCEESPGYLEQLIDSCLQSDTALEPAFSAFQPSSHYSPDPFQPGQLCSSQGLPQAASSPGSADLPSPWNSSCSPPQLSPLTPSPPSAPDSKPFSCPGQEWPCQPPCPFPSPACCCTACGSQSTDSRDQQCFPCPSTDWNSCLEFLPGIPGPLAVAEDFFRRDRSCDICYS